jgi:hypothetical protein
MKDCRNRRFRKLDDWRGHRCDIDYKNPTRYHSLFSGIVDRVTSLGEFSHIGRLINSGSYFKLRKKAKFLLHFFRTIIRSFVMILTKTLVGLHFGRFFTNSAGHPDRSTCFVYPLPDRLIHGETAPPPERAPEWPGEFVKNQGDQIGRICACWRLFTLGRYFLITDEAQICGLLFPTAQVLY